MHPTAENLLIWFQKNQRDLPWRQDKNPYKIWLSEIILQQTRVDQGTAYYLRFIDVFPNVFSLAEADEEQVLKLWQGLGYYSRARNLHATAKIIAHQYQGSFPTSYDELVQLKGIGPYTASAIASIAFNEKKGVVDGNVLRVISRLFDSDLPVDRPEGQKWVQQTMDELIPDSFPGDFNQAVMELGALVCTPTSPACHQCPLLLNCQARQRNTQTQLPVKLGKTKVTEVEWRYVILIAQGEICVRLRSEKGIWKGLYDFPSIDSHGDINDDLLQVHSLANIHPKQISELPSFTHLLSHRKITAHSVVVHLDTKCSIPQDCKWISISELHALPVPRLIEKIMREMETLSIL
jgi:A/G-specific adenine glycosylase